MSPAPGRCARVPAISDDALLAPPLAAGGAGYDGTRHAHGRTADRDAGQLRERRAGIRGLREGVEQRLRQVGGALRVRAYFLRASILRYSTARL